MFWLHVCSQEGASWVQAEASYVAIGCGCPEILEEFGGLVTPAQLERIYEGDVRALSALGFDGVKL